MLSAKLLTTVGGAGGGEPTDNLILPVGDSKSSGDSWRTLLTTLLTTVSSRTYSLHTSTGFAADGATIATIAAIVDAQLADASGSANIALINLGANDVVSLPAEATWKANLTYVIDALLVKWPNVSVYVARPWRRNYATECDTLASWIAAVVGTYPSGVAVGMDERVWLEGGDDGATMTADGIHYGTAGQTAAAVQWEAVLVGSGVWTPVYMLRDDFTTAAAAPLTSPRSAEPGPGMLTVTDVENKLSVSGEALQIASGRTVPVSLDPAVFETNATVRAVGYAAIFKFSVVTHVNGPYIGFSALSSPTANSNIAVYTSGNVITGRFYGQSDVNLLPYSNGEQITGVVILQTNRATILIKKAGVWYVGYVSLAGSTNYRAFVGNYSSIGISVDFLRTLMLPAPFSTDYGFASQQLAGARSAGDTLTHAANCLLEWTQTAIPSALQTEVRFRIQDATNYWQVTVDSTGALDLDEVVAGTPTQRGTAAGVIANGDRIVVIADGTTIRVYEANTLRITYTSAANFATATAGKLETEGTGGSVSDLVSWPRTLTGSAAAILDQVSA